jgi:APA family basic amino acid/polyamine antiporter
MLGAGVFVVFGPAAKLAGSYLLLSIALAGIIASLNARSMRQLSKALPKAGGAYAFGREYLSNGWGFLAGLAFIIGKIGSVAAIALAAASYLYPTAKVEVAFAALAIMTLVNLLGINRTALGSILLSLPTVVVLLLVGLTGLQAVAIDQQPPSILAGVLPAAALIFFAFAGYARVATLGPEVKDPSTNIPRAISIALVFVIGLYFLVGFALQSQLGLSLQDSVTPVQDFAARALPWLPSEVVVLVAASACLGSLLSLLAGISRTSEAMAQDGELPKMVSIRSNRFNSPWVADLFIFALASLLLISGDLTWTIGISSFCVLVYYAIANFAAFRQVPASQLPPKVLALLGGVFCLILALSVPIEALVLATVVLSLTVAVRASLIKMKNPR